jgi:hypothetical protein
MQGEMVGSSGKALQLQCVVNHFDLGACTRKDKNSSNFLPEGQKIAQKFLKSRYLDSAFKKRGFSKLNLEEVCQQKCLAHVQTSNSAESSQNITHSTEKVNNPQPATSSQITSVFHKNSTVSHSFHDQVDILEASFDKVLFGLKTIEAAKAEGTEDGILKAQLILSSLGWRKKSNKRGRKPHCPLLKDICGGIKHEIEQKVLKKELKRKLNEKAKQLKAEEPMDPQTDVSKPKKKPNSSEGLSMLRLDLFTSKPAPLNNTEMVAVPRFGTSWGDLSHRMEEENHSSAINMDRRRPRKESTQVIGNNNEDLVSVFGGHGSILSLRYLQRRKGSSSSYIQSVLGALRDRTETAHLEANENCAAIRNYLGGDQFLTSLVGSKARLLEDQASIGPELSLYLAHSGSFRMFGDPNYDVEY